MSDNGAAAGRVPAGTPRARSRATSRRLAPDFVKLYVSAGRAAGVRPADLVGAITGEAAVPGDAVGAIEIGDRFSIVEVSDGDADAVLEALRRATIRGRRVTASRYQPKAKRPPRS